MGINHRQAALFPLLYQAQYAAYQQDLPFWLDLAALAGGPLLELGCGTGRVALPLAEAGYEVYGIDRNAGMLAVLQAQTPTKSAARMHIFQGDMRSYRLEKRFALILSPCNTISTLALDALRACLGLACRHLKPGGLFAASIPNPQVIRGLPTQSDPEPEEEFPHPVTGHPVQVSTGWQRRHQQMEVIWHYDHLLPDGQVERLTWRSTQQLYPPEIYFEALATAGLRVIQTLGDFDGTLYSRVAPQLILVATQTLGGEL